jgi:GntR family transcriptional repressor for pyruvate dehydrogenase complex
MVNETKIQSPESAGESPFTPVVTTRTFETAIDRIIEGIERAHLRPGDRLPKEADLADQLQISKATLRQALRVLERAGTIEVRRGAGGGVFLVSDLVPTEAVMGEVAIEEGAVVDVLTARRLIEGAVTEVAVGAATGQDWKDIERSIELLRQHVGDLRMAIRADVAFHRAVVRACRNRALERAMGGLARELIPIREAYIGGADSHPQILAIHERQLEAMQSRNLTELANVMDEHFRMLEEAYSAAVGGRWSDLFGRGPHHFVVRLTGPGVGAYLSKEPFAPIDPQP